MQYEEWRLENAHISSAPSTVHCPLSSVFPISDLRAPSSEPFLMYSGRSTVGFLGGIDGSVPARELAL